MENRNSNNEFNIFNRKKDSIPNANPFSVNSDNPFQRKEVSNPIKRINNYDSVMLNNLDTTPNDSVEYRLRETESLLNDLDAKIEIADRYGTQNEALSLRAKKQRLSKEVETLKKQRKISGGILGDKVSKTRGNYTPIFQKIIRFFSKNVLARMSSGVNSVVVLGDSLEQLSEINSNIDELLDMKVPYGEKVKNYETLTQYLNKANVIHSNITKSLGKIK